MVVYGQEHVKSQERLIHACGLYLYKYDDKDQIPCSRDLEVSTVTKLAFYRTRRFTSTFTIACH
jgi:hypothetical protein